MPELEPHQLAAVQRLRDALAEIDSYSAPPDDAFVTVDNDNEFTQLNDEVGAMLTLGHLRDIFSIFAQES